MSTPIFIYLRMSQNHKGKEKILREIKTPDNLNYYEVIKALNLVSEAKRKGESDIPLWF